MYDDDRDLEQRISARAYSLWQAAGSPAGRDQEFWYNARLLEEQLARDSGAGWGGDETDSAAPRDRAPPDVEAVAAEDGSSTDDERQSDADAGSHRPWWKWW